MARSDRLIGDWYDDTEDGIDHGSDVRTPLGLGVTDIEPPDAFRSPGENFRTDVEAHKYTDHIIGRAATREAIVDAWLRNDRLAEPIPVSETDDGHPCVAVTAGGQAAIHHAVNAALSDGGKALLIEPYYPYHAKSVRVFQRGDAVVTVETDATEGFEPPVETIRDVVATEPIEALVLCSPDNPTGVQYDHDWLARVATVACAEDLTVISDEVYAFLAFGDAPHRSIATFPGMAERTLVVGSFSKVLGLSGWRLGFLRVPEAFVDPVRHVIDAVSMQSVTPGQVLLEETLRGKDPMTHADVATQRFRDRMEVLIEPFEDSEKTAVHRPEGGFYLFPTVAEPYRGDPAARGGYETAREELPNGTRVRSGDCLFYHLLTEAGVEGVPGRTFGDGLATEAVRLAFGNVPATELEDAADRIAGALETF